MGEQQSLLSSQRRQKSRCEKKNSYSLSKALIILSSRCEERIVDNSISTAITSYGMISVFSLCRQSQYTEMVWPRGIDLEWVLHCRMTGALPRERCYTRSSFPLMLPPRWAKHGMKMMYGCSVFLLIPIHPSILYIILFESFDWWEWQWHQMWKCFGFVTSFLCLTHCYCLSNSKKDHPPTPSTGYRQRHIIYVNLYIQQKILFWKHMSPS